MLEKLPRNRSAEKITNDVELEASGNLDNTSELSDVSKSIAETAVKSALILPSKSVEIGLTSVGVPFVDRRGFTLQSVEAEYQEEKDAIQKKYQDRQEKLRQPLSDDEIRKLLERATVSLNTQIEKQDSWHHFEVLDNLDLVGDLNAIAQLRDIYSGKYIFWGKDPENSSNGLGPNERLEDLIRIYSNSSNRGSVDRNTGEIHNSTSERKEGLYYEFAKAKQILDKLSNDPKSAREKVIFTKKPDIEWLVNDALIDETTLGQTSEQLA